MKLDSDESEVEDDEDDADDKVEQDLEVAIFSAFLII